MLYLNRKKRTHFSRVFTLTGKIIRGTIKISRAVDAAEDIYSSVSRNGTATKIQEEILRNGHWEI